MNKLWVNNARDIKQYREYLISKQDNLDPILKKKLHRPCLDHDHKTGRCRGVISQCINTFEGRVLKYFNKYVKHNTNLSLSAILRNLADYLDKDQDNNPYHIDIINSKNKHLKKFRKESIITLLEKDFDIKIGHELTKQKIISIYLENYKLKIENG